MPAVDAGRAQLRDLVGVDDDRGFDLGLGLGLGSGAGSDLDALGRQAEDARVPFSVPFLLHPSRLSSRPPSRGSRLSSPPSRYPRRTRGHGVATRRERLLALFGPFLLRPPSRRLLLLGLSPRSSLALASRARALDAKDASSLRSPAAAAG